MPRYSSQPSSAVAQVPRPAQADPSQNDPVWKGVADIGQAIGQVAQIGEHNEALQKQLDAADDAQAVMNGERFFREGVAGLSQKWLEAPIPNMREAQATYNKQIADLETKTTAQFGNPDRPLRQARLLSAISVPKLAFTNAIAESSLGLQKERFKASMVESLDGHLATALDSATTPDQQELYRAAAHGMIQEGVNSGMVGAGKGQSLKAVWDKNFAEHLAKTNKEALDAYQAASGLTATERAGAVIRSFEDPAMGAQEIALLGQAELYNLDAAEARGDILPQKATELREKVRESAHTRFLALGKEERTLTDAERVSQLNSIADATEQFAGTLGAPFDKREEAFANLSRYYDQAVAQRLITRGEADTRIVSVKHNADQALAKWMSLSPDPEDQRRLIQLMAEGGIPGRPETLPNLKAEERPMYAKQALDTLNAGDGKQRTARKAENLKLWEDWLSKLKNEGLPKGMGSLMPDMAATGDFTQAEIDRMLIQEAFAAKFFQQSERILHAPPEAMQSLVNELHPVDAPDRPYQQRLYDELGTKKDAELALRGSDPGLVGVRESGAAGQFDPSRPETISKAITARLRTQKRLGIVIPAALAKQEAGDWAHAWVQSPPDQKYATALAWRATLGEHYPRVMGEMAKHGDLPPEAEWIPDVNPNTGIMLAQNAGTKYEDLKKVAPDQKEVPLLEARVRELYGEFQGSLPPQLLDGTGQQARYLEAFQKLAMAKYNTTGDVKGSAQWAADRLFNDHYFFIPQPGGGGGGLFSDAVTPTLAVPQIYKDRRDLIEARSAQIIREIDKENVDMTQVGVPLTDAAARELWKRQLIEGGRWITTGDQTGAILYHPDQGQIVRKDGSVVSFRFDGQGWPKPPAAVVVPVAPPISVPANESPDDLKAAYSAFKIARDSGDKAAAKAAWDRYKAMGGK